MSEKKTDSNQGESGTGPLLDRRTAIKSALVAAGSAGAVFAPSVRAIAQGGGGMSGCPDGVCFYNNCTFKDFCFSGQVHDIRIGGNPPATVNVDMRITWVAERWRASGNCPVDAICFSSFFNQPPCIGQLCANVPTSCNFCPGNGGLCGTHDAPILVAFVEFWEAGHLSDPMFKVDDCIFCKVDCNCVCCNCPGL